MKRVLVVKMSSLGDIIHAFPVLQFINQYDPQIKIDWVVEKPFADLVRAHPLISTVLCVQTKKWRSKSLSIETWREAIQFRRELQTSSYDIVLDLQGNVKSACVTALAKSPLKAGFDYSSVAEWPNIFVTNKRYNPPKNNNIRDDYLFIAQSALGNFTPIKDQGVKLKLSVQEKSQLAPIMELCQKTVGLKVLVCPGSNWSNKQLSKETLRDFLNCFSKELFPHFLLLWGNQAEKIIVDELQATLSQRCTVIPKLSLPSLQNLMAEVDLVLAMDSLPLHLAGISSTPTYSFFGPSSALKYKPVGHDHEAFQGSCPYGRNFEKRCDILRTCKTGACIKELEGSQLFDHFLKWWTGRTF